MKQLDAATLPLQGWHLIEASAGTGKTYNIVRIYLRLLLEAELTVDQILVVTFTRAATQELKGRIVGLIRETLAVDWDNSKDEFLQEISQKVDELTAKELLKRALLSIDEAAVYTIHGFCKRALTQQAFASRISFGAVMETDSTELVMEALRDWYRLQAEGEDYEYLYSLWSTPESFYSELREIITNSEQLVMPDLVDLESALNEFSIAWKTGESEEFYRLNVNRRGSKKADWENYQNLLDKLAENPSSYDQLSSIFTEKFWKESLSTDKKKSTLSGIVTLADVIPKSQRLKTVALAQAGVDFCREHVRAAKQRLDQLDYNDLITELDTALRGDNGSKLAGLLFEQFPAALVDEFQDTDPQQFSIFENIYSVPSSQGAEEKTPFVCMIGDPKQAIYGFRGGDVFAYLSARDKANFHWDMNKNFRSHQSVIDGCNRLFHGSELDSPASDQVFGFGIEYFPVEAGRDDIAELQDSYPAALQWVDFSQIADSDSVSKDFQANIAEWSAQEAGRFLNRAKRSGEPIKASDIAVLVRNRSEATEIKRALDKTGINSVYLSGRENVFRTLEADQLIRFLHGVLELENPRLLRSALATPWFGASVREIYQLAEDDGNWDHWMMVFIELRNTWHQRGLMTMALGVMHKYFQPVASGESRQLTNTMHLLELCQQASQTHRQPWALLNWLREAQQEAAQAPEKELRLESDDQIVKIVTLHGSKGLEYPVVFLPFVSYGNPRNTRVKLARYHDRDSFNVHYSLKPSKDIEALWREENNAEDVRLLYVGATRAIQRLIIPVAPFQGIKQSMLAKCLGDKTDIEGVLSKIEHFVDSGYGSLRKAEEVAESKYLPSVEPPAEHAEPSQFKGRIERDWWLSSFSSLSRNLRQGGESVRDRDQISTEGVVVAARMPLRFRMVKGAEAGNLLHDVMENLDFSSPDYEAAFSRPALRYAAIFESFTSGELQKWIEEVINTELPVGTTLAQLKMQHTLRESEFYFSMDAVSDNSLSELANIVSQHLQIQIVLPGKRRLKGMMHGFMDLVFEHDGKYYVADYKSNWLGGQLTDYDYDAMHKSMLHSLYHLQYLIYSLALHRYLKTRLADYDPRKHFGGAVYLFLRGMQPGSETGVYHRQVEPEILEKLDALFAYETTAWEALV